MTFTSSLSDLTQLLPASTQANELGCLTITGPDSIKFLQGQTSCDFEGLSHDLGLQGAICNIKGRVIANFYALKHEDDILLILSSDLLESVLTHLKKFAVFFKTTLSNSQDNYQVNYVFSQESLIPQVDAPYPCYHVDAQHLLLAISQADLKQYLYVRPKSTKTHPKIPANNESLQGLNMLSGQALISQTTTEKYIPQMLNMQKTHGISFKKGCYTGQEIVARMQYRGNLKKHLYLLSADTKLSIPALAKLTNEGGKEVAEVINSLNLGTSTLIFAIIGDESAQNPLFWQQSALSLESLPYQ